MLLISVVICLLLNVVFFIFSLYFRVFVFMVIVGNLEREIYFGVNVWSLGNWVFCCFLDGLSETGFRKKGEFFF